MKPSLRSQLSYFIVLMLSIPLISVEASPIAAQSANDANRSPQETWILDEIKNRQWANLDDFCTAKAPPQNSNWDWQVQCHVISADFLREQLTGPAKDAIPFSGIKIKSARIVGDLDLENASLAPAVQILGSQFEGSVTLRHARTSDIVSFDGSRFYKNLDAAGFQSKSDLSLANGTVISGDLDLTDAKVDGIVNLRAITLEANFNADRLQVGGDLYMNTEGGTIAKFKHVALRDANISGQMTAYGAIFQDQLDADSVKIGGSLLMGAAGSTGTKLTELVLRQARIKGLLDLNAATLSGAIYAGLLQVDGHVYFRETHFSDRVVLALAHLNGNLDLRGANLAGLDLSGASIAGDLQLGGAPEKSASWVRDPTACESRRQKSGSPVRSLSLRNTHIGNLVDARNAWPPTCQIYLDGFTFSHLGGYQGETEGDMKARGAWWDKSWARLDPDYSPTPYVQLTAALANAGDRNASNQIRYLGRVRARAAESTTEWIFSGFLQYVAGFGIGSYTFRVLYWILGISVFGALYLRLRSKGVREGEHGLIWCFGATLSRLLPVIQINKEFADFFSDPEGKRLTKWQNFVFSLIGIIGFVLSAILIAAISGLTQGA